MAKEIRVGATATVHQRFPLRQHRGKACRVVYVGDQDNGYGVALELIFEDGEKCLCTTDDMGASRFTNPVKAKRKK